MKKVAICLLLLCAISFSTTAQQSWGKIDAKQFDVRICPIDSSANAMVLFDKCTISFLYQSGGFYVQYLQHKRIQILNKEGFSEASISLPFYQNKNSNIGIELKAQTLNKTADGKVAVTEIEGKDFFEERESEHYYKKKFSFKNVKEGSVIEYQYTFQTQALRFLRNWTFQSELPTLRSSVRLKSLEYFHYAAILQSSMPLDERTSEPFSQYLTNGFMGNDRTDVQGTESLYAMNNVPALKTEKYITTMSDYQSQIIFVLNSITFPGRPIETLNDNWTKVSDEMLKNDRFGLYLDGVGEHLKVAKELTKNLTDLNEKIKIIYAHLLSKMKWDRHSSFIPSDPLTKAYAAGTGNSADINMLLIDMLRAAGVKSDPVVVSTRENGKVQKIQPDMTQFNQVIAAAETDSGTIYLDATSSLRPIYLLAERDLNFIGLRMKPGDAQWVEINPVKASSSTIIMNLEIDSTGRLLGKANLVTKDYESIAFRAAMQSQTADECLKDILVIRAESEIANATASNLNEPDKKLKINFDIKDESKTDHLIYINPFPVKFRDDNPFKLSKRTYPINFSYPFEESIKVSLTIADNYKVSELPKSINVTLEDGSASFVMMVGQDGKTVQMNSTLKILKSEYQPIAYDILKNLFARLLDSYNSLIVLEKK